MRPYKDYSWKNLLKIRDALVVIKELILQSTREFEIFDEELYFVSEEIDWRYKNDKTEGGE